MDAALAGLLGTSVGAVAGVLGGFVTGRQQQKNELMRWRQQRDDDVWKEERRSLLELTNLLAEASQAVVWLAWAATVKSVEAVKADANEYDGRMRAILPRLFSAQAAASGLSEQAFAQIDPLVQELLTLDTALGEASVRLGFEPEEAVREMRNAYHPAVGLTRRIVLRVRAELRVDRRTTLEGLDRATGPTA
jgi:hypothetical protein